MLPGSSLFIYNVSRFLSVQCNGLSYKDNLFILSIIKLVIPSPNPLLDVVNKFLRETSIESINFSIEIASLHCSFKNTFILNLFLVILLVVLFIVFPILGSNSPICFCCSKIMFFISLLSFTKLKSNFL